MTATDQKTNRLTRTLTHMGLALSLGLGMSGSIASADELTVTPLSFLAATALQDETVSGETVSDASEDSVTLDDSKNAIPFGSAGATHLSFGTGIAWNLDEDIDSNLNIGLSRFIADDLEVGAELATWYFAQEGQDTLGFNLNMLMRYHVWHTESYDWSAYVDLRIGVLGSLDTVPDGGTGLNFTPGAGFGITHLLNDDGLRLQTGVRWHHISNGRYNGDLRNPSRDSVMVYAGISIPW